MRLIDRWQGDRERNVHIESQVQPEDDIEAKQDHGDKSSKDLVSPLNVGT